MHHDLHSRSHCVRLLQALSNDRPSLLWVRLAGPCAGSGNRKDASRTAHLCELINLQKSAPRGVVIEANARSQVWNMQHLQLLTSSLWVTEHAWCRYEVTQHKPCNTIIRLATNFPMSSKSCECDQRVKHFDSKHLGKEREGRWAQVLSSIAASAIELTRTKVGQHVTCEAADDDQHRQPELNFANCSSNAVRQTWQVSARLPNTVCALEQAESMARAFRLQSDARCETCYRLLRSTPFKTTSGSRQVAGDEAGFSECYVFGFFAHGSFSGVTKATNQHPELIRYLNLFISAREKQSRWSSLSINNNNPLRAHRDLRNQKGTPNILICVGDFTGGGLWLEETSEIDQAALQCRRVGDLLVYGQVHDCHDKALLFNPELFHETEAWSGDRWSLSAYTSRGLMHLNQPDLDKLRSLKFPVGKSVHFHSSPEDESMPAYPTEEAEKRKARIKAGHIIKLKKFTVEQCDDDLGDDLSSIVEHTDCVAWTPELYGARCESVCAQHEFEADIQAFIAGKYRWMHGSTAVQPMSRLKSRGVFNMEQFFNAKAPFEDDFVEVMEIFGGDATTTWILSKKHGVRTGWNFDMTVGVNLLNPPLVVILAPPCRCYGALSHMNRVINREGFEINYANDRRLVELSAAVAAFQMECGNHFVAEQPVGSSMFASPEWTNRMKGWKIFEIKFDQCMVGLTDPRTRLPVKKPTRLVSSCAEILIPFQGLQCRGHAQHATISSLGKNGPSVPSQPMQIWPAKLCDVLAQGIIACFRKRGVYETSYAAGDRAKCPGCRWHKRKDHPSHDRSEHCKFPNVEASKWTCPGCLQNKPRGDSKHTLDQECQWNTARVMPEGLGRERKGGHPRDGRVPTSAEPTAALGDPPLRAVGSRESHPEDTRDLRDLESESVMPLRAGRAGASSGSAAPRRRDAEVQSSEGGTGPAMAPPPAAAKAASRPHSNPPAAADDQAAEDRVEGDRWASFDLGRDLRSIREGVARRALRKLHIRWYHAPAQKMRTLLSAVGWRSRRNSSTCSANHRHLHYMPQLD